MSTTNSSPQQRRQVGRVAPCRTRQEDQVPPKWLSRPARPSMRHLLNLERSARPRRADDISPLHSPLLALTTGSGRSQRQLERVVENLKLRNTGTYVHPTVATVESHGPQLRHAVAQSILDLLIEHRLFDNGAIDDAGGRLPSGFVLRFHGGVFALSLDRIATAAWPATAALPR